MMNNAKVQKYYNDLSKIKLGNPMYIDPLYVPYHSNYEISPLKTPYAINSGYPLNDSYRRHMGKGLDYRSKYFGYCSPGYENRPDKNSITPQNPLGINTGMCYKLEEENVNDASQIRSQMPNKTLVQNVPPIIGTFYSNIKDHSNPQSWMYGYGMCSNASKNGYAKRSYNDNTNPTIGGVRSANGLNEMGRFDDYKCLNENFW